MKYAAQAALGVTAALVVLFLLDTSVGISIKTLVAAGFFAVASIVLALLSRSDK